MRFRKVIYDDFDVERIEPEPKRTDTTVEEVTTKNGVKYTARRWGAGMQETPMRDPEMFDPTKPVLNHDEIFDELFATPKAPGPAPVAAPKADLSFPLGILAKPIKDIVDSASEMAQCPPDMSAQICLGCVSAIVAKNVAVLLGSRCEPSNLWLVTGAPSSEHKSTVMGLLLKPFEKIERELADAVAPARRRWEVELGVLKEQLKHAQSQYAKGKLCLKSPADIGEEIRQHEENEVHIPRICADDCTPEAMSKLLTKHGHMSIISTEATIIGNMGGKYQQNGQADLSSWNKMWSGDRSIRDRTTEHGENNGLLSICTLVQPGVLQRLAGMQDSRVSGLLSKFLYSIPASRVGERVSRDYVIPADHVEAWDALLRSLLKIPKCSLTLSHDESSISPDALSIHHQFCNFIEEKMRAGRDMAHVADWAGKVQSGQQLRLAAILHCCEHANDASFPTEISLETQKRAIALCNYYCNQALSVFADFESPNREACEKIVRVCQRAECKTIPKVLRRKTIYDNVGKVTDKKNAVKAALEELTNAGTLVRRPNGDFEFWGAEQKSVAAICFPVEWEAPAPVMSANAAKPNIPGGEEQPTLVAEDQGMEI